MMKGWAKVASRVGLAAMVVVTIAMGVAQAAKPVEIRFAYMGSQEEADIYQRLIEQYNANHPQIHVKGEYWTGSYFDKLKTSIAAGDPPDIFHVWTEEYMYPFVTGGVLLDLAPYVEKDKAFNLADFPPNLLAAARYKDGLYALPRDIAIRVLFYNKDIFDTAGIPYPDESWTWDRMRDVGRKLSQKDPATKQAKILTIDWGWWWGAWMNMVWMWGGQVSDQPVTRLYLNSPQARAGLQFMIDAMKEGWMGGPTLNWTGLGFHEGKVATKWTGYWDIPWAYRTFKFDWDVTPVPAGPAGRTTTLGSNWYGVAAMSKHPAEAVDFVKYLESEGLAMYANLGGALPARLSLLISDSFLQPGKTPLHRRVFVEAIPTAKWPPLTPYWNRLVNETLDPELAKAFSGEVSLDQAIRAIMDKAQAILK